MKNQIFSPVGILPPFAGTIPEGATVVELLNSTDSTAFTEGETVQLVPAGTDVTALVAGLDIGFVDMTDPTAPGTGDTDHNISFKCFGVLLEDIADAARGLVCVRADLVIADVGGAADINQLRNMEDLETHEAVKIIAMARNSTQITAVSKKCAVMFNGIEGFGSVVGI
mgnify:CR=1 FL=1